MADEIIFESEEGKRLNELVYRRTIRGMPSPPVKFYAKNISEERTYQGPLFVAPGEGPSFSQDVYVGDEYEAWGRSVQINLIPGQRTLLRSRIIPRSTPAGQPGRARIIAMNTQDNWTIT